MILYGVPIWADAISSNPNYGTDWQRACRTITLRVNCALYRIVSDNALSIIAARGAIQSEKSANPTIRNQFEIPVKSPKITEII